MPIYEYECLKCGSVFEVLLRVDETPPPCPNCESSEVRKLIAAAAFHVKQGVATAGIEKRVKGYLKDGKFSDATRFADMAASMVKSDKVKKISDKLHEKTGK